jgi:hypothetical protein
VAIAVFPSSYRYVMTVRRDGEDDAALLVSM